MKKTHLLTFLFVILVTLTVFTLSSCYVAQPSNTITGSEINSKGELIVTYSDGTKLNLGEVAINQGDMINVTSDASDTAAATAKGLLSCVRVSATFTKTVTNPYLPGLSGGNKTEYSSAGAGVIYELDSESGSCFVITNYHVVYDSASDSGVSGNIMVALYGEQSTGIPAEYVGGSMYYDIAVLRINNCNALKRSDYAGVDIATDEVYPGEVAIAIGNPENYGISASSGIVSVASEYITMTAADEVSSVTQRVIRVDTAVNSGNSGGGLFNGRGELVGIVNAKIVDDSVENIGYAIPASVAIGVANNIIDNCYGKECETVQRAMIGITLGVTDSKAEINSESGRIDVVESVAVKSVNADSAAYGKLVAGDVLISATLNDKTISITRDYHIIDLMLGARAGDTLTLVISRSGVEMTVRIDISADSISSY
ncbi:MAG: trypsin-like peptidase domain-containing protein [Clostridia bacterium]|nr:trypsin-like peptidase domain-containing protein [Clostridia bacterium]